MTTHKPKIAVFIDWQNAYKTAREAFDLIDMPNEFGNFSPLRLGRFLGAGNDRGPGGFELIRVFVHRGLPSQKHDHTGYAANRRQAAAWENEGPGVVFPRLRPLRYPFNYPDEPPVEKGVDVDLAIMAFETIVNNHADVAIIFSHDSDLAPVPEAIGRVAGNARVETASWVSGTFNYRIRVKGNQVHHHAIGAQGFNQIATPFNYAQPAS